MISSLTEHEALRSIEDRLYEWTGIQPSFSQSVGARDLDGRFDIGGLSLFVELKGEGDVATVAGAIEQVRATRDAGVHVVVAVPYMSAGGRERCEAAGVSWIDLSGNARLRASAGGTHVAVWVEGLPNAFVARGRPRNVFAPRAARAARTLLLSAKPLTQAEIAERAGLDPGYTSRTVRRLEKLGLLVRDSSGAVSPASRALLLDAWAEANAFKHSVVTGHLPGRSGEERARRLAGAFRGGTAYALTGLAAAWAYTHEAGFRSVTSYVSGPFPDDALADAGWRTVTDAPNVRLLVPDDTGVFDGARVADGLQCVSPVQAYVDLRHDAERADEFVEALRPLALNA